MSQSQQRQRSRAELVTAIAATIVMVGVQAWAVWVMLPPQQRFWIRLAVAGRVRSLSAMAAWRQGHLGMGEELRTGQRSARYLAAWGLSTVRDQTGRMLEAMRP